MHTMLCRAGAAACSSLLPAMARAGPGELPCGGGKSLYAGAPGSAAGQWRALEIPSHLCLHCTLTSVLNARGLASDLSLGWGTPGFLATPWPWGP